MTKEVTAIFRVHPLVYAIIGTILLIGLVYGAIVPGARCDKNCRADIDMQNYANASQMGIDHVCYDSCVGGASGTYNFCWYEMCWRGYF